MTLKHQALLQREVTIPIGEIGLVGDLTVPENASGIVVFAHGSGSSRHSSRNRFVARMLNASGLATLLFDLLTPQEEPMDRYSQRLRFDIHLLSSRLTQTVRWVSEQPEMRDLKLGLFGASTGAAAALITAANEPTHVQAVVSRGGRPDLAADALRRVQAPTLLIIGGDDQEVLELNRQASAQMQAYRCIEVVPAATHLFEEPGALEHVAALARKWFNRYLSNNARQEA